MRRALATRQPARPSTPRQHARVERIVRSARLRLTRDGPEAFQMGDVAKDAQVSLSTLYRYFPSRAALFHGVMQEQIAEIRTLLPRLRALPRVEAVAELLVVSGQHLFEDPDLSREMIASNLALLGDPDLQVTLAFKRLLCEAARVVEPSAEEDQVIRLMEQVWYGILLSCLNGVITREQAETDTRLGVRLLASHVWA